MTAIRVLSDRVANQIAAGEVIERPAAVVKELVENSLDAGATRVEVEFNHGGRSYMRIEDNGSGMSRDDAHLALERHATSKIVEADDLNRLATFGFRGEALPSIASVSRFQLQTRQAAADSGTEILINGGKLVHVRDCGRPTGTRIEVAQLFNSVPARRKFLKSDATEAAHIIQSVRLYALAFPQVAFTLIEDGRVIFQSPKHTTLIERIGGIFGKQIADGLIPLEAAEGGMRLYGLIGLPGQGRSTRHEMITFINQRPVDSRTLNYALIESYHESLPKGRYPVAFVFLEISPAEVDVNVHPAKREVRFRSEPAVRSFVIRSILERLRELTLGSPAGPVATDGGETPRTIPSPWAGFSNASVGNSLSTLPGEKIEARGPIPASGSIALAAKPWPTTVVTLPPREPHLGPIGVGTGSAPPVETLKQWRLVGLAHRHYAIFETPGGLGLLDRRAAQERIWYERLQAAYRRGDVSGQRLLLPVTIELDAIASALVLDAREFLAAHGFEVSEFGRNFFRLESIPEWMEPGHAETFLRDLLGLLREGQLQAKDLERARDQLARFAATRGIRLSETASETELRALIGELFACRSPLTSPNGRPTYVELSHGELGRRFGR